MRQCSKSVCLNLWECPETLAPGRVEGDPENEKMCDGARCREGRLESGNGGFVGLETQYTEQEENQGDERKEKGEGKEERMP